MPVRLNWFKPRKLRFGMYAGSWREADTGQMSSRRTNDMQHPVIETTPISARSQAVGVGHKETRSVTWHYRRAALALRLREGQQSKGTHCMLLSLKLPIKPTKRRALNCRYQSDCSIVVLESAGRQPCPCVVFRLKCVGSAVPED